MLLVIGGACQGKLDYVRTNCSVCEEEIVICADTAPDWSKRALVHLERFSLACVREGLEPLDVLRDGCTDVRDKIFVANDISSGVVPTDAVLREWRDAHGRMLNALAKEADSVVRLFCGLPQVLK